MDLSSSNKQISLTYIMNQLTENRPIFHSEADFQHAFAWELHKHLPDCNIRLEVNPFATDQRAYLDILMNLNNQLIAIELKYKTRKLELDYYGEAFRLLNQSAADIGRYDFIKDITRLERFTNKIPGSRGVAIMLTNDYSYYNPPTKYNQVDKEFRIHKDRILKGNLKWDDRASAGTKRGRENDLVLNKEYSLQWNHYSSVSENHNGHFKYLMVPIG